MSLFDNVKRARGDDNDEDLLPSDSKRQRHKEHGQPQILTNDDYIVGWICALYIEMAAAQAMLDHVHDIPLKDPVDSNTYTLNIFIACLPTGTNNAATVVSHMRRSFPSIRVVLMVGVGGGVPGEVDVRLGDVVVVSTSMIQYDLGKIVADGYFQGTGSSYAPWRLGQLLPSYGQIMKLSLARYQSSPADLLSSNPDWVD